MRIEYTRRRDTTESRVLEKERVPDSEPISQMRWLFIEQFDQIYGSAMEG